MYICTRPCHPPMGWVPYTAPVALSPSTPLWCGTVPRFLFRPNTYVGTCTSIERIYMRPSRLKR